MANLLKTLADAGLASPPSWVPDNICYLVIAGSRAYGTNTADSDYDLLGCFIPRKEDAFPHLRGEIVDFGTRRERCLTYDQKHIVHPSGKEYGFNVHSLIKFCNLLLDCNPDVTESLFVPHECVIYTNAIGQILRENRKSFLHKGIYHRLKGYAYSQFHKMRSKGVTGKRKEIRDTFGYDTKFAMHCIRLMLECEQILTEGDLDLRRHSEQLKAIRRGEISLERVDKIYAQKERQLEELYHKSSLPYKRNEEHVKNILLSCLEHHYGNLSDCVAMEGREAKCVNEIIQVLKRFNMV